MRTFGKRVSGPRTRATKGRRSLSFNRRRAHVVRVLRLWQSSPPACSMVTPFTLVPSETPSSHSNPVDAFALLSRFSSFRIILRCIFSSFTPSTARNTDMVFFHL